MSTTREKALANAINRLSGSDLSKFVDFVSSNGTQSLRLSCGERYYLMREILKYGDMKSGEQE